MKFVCVFAQNINILYPQSVTHNIFSIRDFI